MELSLPMGTVGERDLLRDQARAAPLQVGTAAVGSPLTLAKGVEFRTSPLRLTLRLGKAGARVPARYQLGQRSGKSGLLLNRPSPLPPKVRGDYITSFKAQSPKSKVQSL